MRLQIGWDWRPEVGNGRLTATLPARRGEKRGLRTSQLSLLCDALLIVHCSRLQQVPHSSLNSLRLGFDQGAAAMGGMPALAAMAQLASLELYRPVDDLPTADMCPPSLKSLVSADRGLRN